MNLVALIQVGLAITLPLCFTSFLLDCYFYGKFTVPQLNFVWQNVVLNLSVYFGDYPWYFYLQELPMCFNGLFPLVLIGLYSLTQKQL
jgi:phosphatidylinositol glycan class B